MSSCKLCALNDGTSEDAVHLFSLDTCELYVSPFAAKWPGALMLVSKVHSTELTLLRKPALAQAELLMIERAMQVVIKPLRLNVVKFANACEHLHWHLIPRFLDEKFLSLNAWELVEETPETLYGTKSFVTDFPSDIFVKLKEQLLFEMHYPVPNYYAAAFFFRPRSHRWPVYLSKKNITAPLQASMALSMLKASPGEFEFLLMERNYANFEWDMIGGMAERNEFPRDTLVREVREEIGWQVADALECGRQWKYGLTRGFMYVVIPTDLEVLETETPRRICDEVKSLRYFSVEEIISNQKFAKVKNRLQALLEGKADF